MAKQFRKVGTSFILTDSGQILKNCTGVVSVIDTLSDEFQENGVVIDTLIGNVNKPLNFGVSLTKSGSSYVVKVDSTSTVYDDYLTALRAFAVVFKSRKYGNSSSNFYVSFDGSATAGAAPTGETPTSNTENTSGSTSGNATAAPSIEEIINALKADASFVSAVSGKEGAKGETGEQGPKGDTGEPGPSGTSGLVGVGKVNFDIGNAEGFDSNTFKVPVANFDNSAWNATKYVRNSMQLIIQKKNLYVKEVADTASAADLSNLGDDFAVLLRNTGHLLVKASLFNAGGVYEVVSNDFSCVKYLYK